MGGREAPEAGGRGGRGGWAAAGDVCIICWRLTRPDDGSGSLVRSVTSSYDSCRKEVNEGEICAAYVLTWFAGDSPALLRKAELLWEFSTKVLSSCSR